MNLHPELTKTPHYNRCAPRVRQAETRVKKGTGYHPRAVRAAHHECAQPSKTND